MAESFPDPDTTKSLFPSIGRYRIERPLGQGGMGSVFLATDTMLHRRVALKRLVSGRGTDPSLRKRMLLEAQKASRMNNPRIAAVHDVFENGDELILVMEYVEGRTLREQVHARPRLEEFWDIADQCLDALESAHREGIIHGDIKPENVMITDLGQIKLLDFGLARMIPLGDATTLTTTQSGEGGLRGTPPYLPPEALMGLPVDARSDVFSLGVMFYELLAGRRPFDGPDRAETYRRILQESPPSLRDENGEVSSDLETVILAMLAKNREQRYATMTEVREAFLAAQRGDIILPTRIPEPDQETPVTRHIPKIALVLVGVLFVLAAGTFLWREWPNLHGASLPLHRNLAVLPPVVTGGNPDDRFFALGATETLGMDLGPAAREAHLPLFQIRDVLKESAEDAAQAHARFGADLALKSEFRIGDQRLFVKQSVVETKTEHVLRAKQHAFPASASPLEILETLSSDARQMLGLPDGPKQKRKARFGTEGDGSMKLYLEGIGRSMRATTNEDFETAIHSFDLASNIDPAFAQPRAGKGWALFDRYSVDKDKTWLEKAAAEAKVAVSLDSQLTSGHKLLGYVAYRLDDSNGAKQSLERAIALDPCDVTSFRILARAFSRGGDLDGEEAVYRRTIALNGHDWRPHYWLGSQLYARGRFDESRRVLDEVVRLAPENYLGYSNLGGICVMEGQYRDAVENLERSIALYPTADALSNLGTAYFNLRRMNEAILTYNRSFQFGFENYLLWINLGDAYRWSAGKEAEAQKAYREAIERGRKELEERPSHFEIQAELAPILARVGAVDSARTWMAEALEKGADNPNVAYDAALTYWELGQKDVALDYLEKAVRGGYPRTWVRDSAIFDDWRNLPRFQALAAPPGASAKSSNSPNEGGS